jgi:acyl-CoA thioesterase I
VKRLAPVLLIAAIPLWPQAPDTKLGQRIVQLMESTAVATPGLSRASEPIRTNAAATLAALDKTPETPALTWQFMNEVRAYLALADSVPRPAPFPPTADQQYAELREDLARIQIGFEQLLDAQSRSDRKRDADPDQLSRYADADTKAGPPGALPRVVFLGDGATESWRLNEYFSGRDLVNRGIADQTTGQMLGRFRQDVIALNPKAVVIEGGVNDIGMGLGVKQTEDNLAMMGDLAKQHGIHVAFASLLPVSDYHKDADPRYERTKDYSPAAIRALNQWIEGYCRSEGLVFVNYYAATADAGGFMPADESDDGLHPNSKGYRVMSPVATEALTRLLTTETDTAKRRFKLLGK